jgi:hypothetical protein
MHKLVLLHGHKIRNSDIDIIISTPASSTAVSVPLELTFFANTSKRPNQLNPETTRCGSNDIILLNLRERSLPLALGRSRGPPTFVRFLCPRDHLTMPNGLSPFVHIWLAHGTTTVFDSCSISIIKTFDRAQGHNLGDFGMTLIVFHCCPARLKRIVWFSDWRSTRLL